MSLNAKTSHETQIFPLVMFTMSLLIIISNLVPIVGILNMKQLRKNIANYFILSIALNDMFIGLIVIPLGIFQQQIQMNALNEEVSARPQDALHLCDILQMIITFVFFSFVWNTALVSCDRYHRITKPITYKIWMTPRKAIFTLILLHLLIAATAVGLHHWRVISPDSSECIYYKPYRKLLYFTLPAGFFPYGLILYFYIKLIRISQEYRRTRPDFSGSLSSQAATSSRETDERVSVSQRNIVNWSESTDEEAERNKKQVKRVHNASRMLGLIIAVYNISAMPPAIVYFVYTFWPESGIANTPFIFIYPWFNFIHSILNPWIYFSMTKDLRKSTLQAILPHTAWYDTTFVQ